MGPVERVEALEVVRSDAQAKMKKMTLAFAAAGLLAFTGTANAQVDLEEVKDLAEDAMDTQCAEKVRAAAQKVGPKWKGMRTACKALRKCKKTCRASKRGVKKEARGDKRDCKAECRGKKGPAKKACKKSCKKDFRGAKKGARGAKRNCAKDCRGELKTPACKNARKAVWKEIGKTIKGAGQQCFNDAKGLFGG